MNMRSNLKIGAAISAVVLGLGLGLGSAPALADNIVMWVNAPLVPGPNAPIYEEIKAFEAKGTFPSQLEALESPDLLGQVSAFFNEAPTGEILANRAQAITATPFKGPNYFAIHQTVVDGISRVDVDMTDDAASSWQKTLQAFSELGLD